MNELEKSIFIFNDSRLFIDFSKSSIKAILLHNTNVYSPIAVQHSVLLKEKHENIEMVLDKNGADLKILTRAVR